MKQYCIISFLATAAIFSFDIGKRIKPKDQFLKKSVQTIQHGGASSCVELDNNKKPQYVANDMDDLAMASLSRNPFAKVIIMKTW